jgi:hypothetical protein
MTGRPTLGVMADNPFHDAVFEQPQHQPEDCAEGSIADRLNWTRRISWV